MFSGGFNPFYNLRNSPKEEEEKKSSIFYEFMTQPPFSSTRLRPMNSERVVLYRLYKGLLRGRGKKGHPFL